MYIALLINLLFMSKALVLKPNLDYLNLSGERAFYQLNVAQLIEEAVRNGEGSLSDSGALAVDTGKFTGRSPKDRYIVCDELTRDSIWWGDINSPFESERFNLLFNKVTRHLSKGKYYVRDSYACANDTYKMTIRTVTETAYQSLFANNLFLQDDQNDPMLEPEWTIIASPTFLADPTVDGTRQSNFTILNFSKKIILIGGTGYTGEMKKGIFSVLNFILPLERKILPMHCSANIGEAGDTAIFFGLSGTGKTTLSADPERRLIGDDEHGWANDILFNFEGGCYAKCVNLTAENEPQIYTAVKFGALLENTNYFPGTRKVNFEDISKTENTRVAYPLNYIENAVTSSSGNAPANIFFLTADAFGIMPPISKLTRGQAMFHFLSGYTAKIAGTETGISEPQATFSACFGKAFLPLHPGIYANLLGEKMSSHSANVWLINTGWIGGAYGTGTRIDLKHTRTMISAVLNGEMEKEEFISDSLFGLKIPLRCANIPSGILNPRNSWSNRHEYDKQARKLATAFIDNFKQFSDWANEETRAAIPNVVEIVA
jgi:phosphoenolpyruvate carboxykinase (ATP)